MAKEIADIKEFLELIRRQDVNSATVKINKKLNRNGKAFRQTKFKLRGSRYLYTLIVNDAAKAKKLLQSLPPTFNVNKL
ncbi:60S ribosomal protein L38 [Kluyveromyces marxianus]|nr:60S ribosomal protein L38 [Kluyveromyces marxianus]KAG0680141.1 60S ribosomal protein L38 [Kluyveromyces marxianus]